MPPFVATSEFDPLYQWALGAIFIIIFTAQYIFLIYYTSVLSGVAKTASNGTLAVEVADLLLLFIVYVLTTTAMRVGMKRVGLEIDRRKMYSISMYFVGEIAGLLFYYTFYRVLFESVTKIELFAALECVHLSIEWVMYVGRGSRMFYDTMESMRMSQHTAFRSISGFINGHGLSYADWVDFLSLDFALRCLILTMTSAGMCVLVSVLYFTHWINSTLTDINIGQYLSYISAAVVLELINAYAINRVFFAKRQANVLSKLVICFSDVRLCFLTLVVTAMLASNPVFAFTVLQL